MSTTNHSHEHFFLILFIFDISKFKHTPMSIGITLMNTILLFLHLLIRYHLLTNHKHDFIAFLFLPVSFSENTIFSSLLIAQSPSLVCMNHQCSLLRLITSELQNDRQQFPQLHSHHLPPVCIRRLQCFDLFSSYLLILFFFCN